MSATMKTVAAASDFVAWIHNSYVGNLPTAYQCLVAVGVLALGYHSPCLCGDDGGQIIQTV